MSGALDELTVREVRKSYADAGPGASVVTCQSAVALLFEADAPENHFEISP